MRKTIQITIDEQLRRDVDQAAHESGVTRSAFIRDAVRLALHHWQIRRLEAQHIAGYEQQPFQSEEIGDWEAIRMWGDS